MTATFAWLAALVCPLTAFAWSGGAEVELGVEANTRLVIGEGVSVNLPGGLVHRVLREEGKADLFEVRDGSDTMVIVVYRAASAPQPEAARALHVEELVARLDGVELSDDPRGVSLLGAPRRTTRLSVGTPRPRRGWVVAAETGGKKARTVVVAALFAPGSPNEALFAAVASSVKSR